VTRTGSASSWAIPWRNCARIVPLHPRAPSKGQVRHGIEAYGGWRVPAGQDPVHDIADVPAILVPVSASATGKTLMALR